MINKVTLKVLQYKLGDSLDKIRLPGNSRLLVTREDAAVCIKFNRPRFLNSFDSTLINPLVATLSKVSQSRDVNLLVLEGSRHGKMQSFSAGGDILMGRNIIDRRERKNTIYEKDRLYLVNIYRAQHLLNTISSSPNMTVLSLMDGTVMGSGVLFGLNASHSVVTERTFWGLPEVSIAGMPDVGTLYHVNRMEDNLGKMLFLTGTRLKSSRIVHAGLASHFCKSEKTADLKRDILLTNGDQKKIKETLEEYHERSLAAIQGSQAKEEVLELREDCRHVYQSDDVGEITENLKQLDSDWSRQQLTALAKGCPLSIRVSLRLLKEIREEKLDYKDSLVRSYMTAGNIYFYGQMKAGIENALVYRGQAVPDWRMSKAEDVPDSLVDFIFDHRFKEQILTLDQLQDKDVSKPY